ELVRRRKRLRHPWGRRFRLPTPNSRLSCLAILLSGLLCATAQVNPEPASFRIAVDVNLVVLPIAVHDRQGRYASDLHEQDFEVYEDRIAQRIKLFRHDD